MDARTAAQCGVMHRGGEVPSSPANDRALWAE